MYHIFISYSRRDLDLAREIVDSLKEHRLETWIDWDSIPKGENWEQEIYRGIEEADAFLFLLSPDSIESAMCNREIARAVKNNKRIIPVVVRDADTDDFLEGESNQEILKRNWIYCRAGRDDFASAIQEIQTTIRTDYDWVRFHTSLQVKALAWERAKQDKSRLLRGKELKDSKRMIAQVGQAKEPPMTSIQLQYMSKSGMATTRRRALVIAILLSVVMIAGWWDKTWYRLLPIESSPPAISHVTAEITGIEVLPPTDAQQIEEVLDKDYISLPGSAELPASEELLLVYIEPVSTDAVSIRISLPVTPAYKLDFLPEVRAFVTETVTIEEAVRLIKGVSAYSVGRFGETIEALKGTDSLSGKILLAQAYLFEGQFVPSRKAYEGAIKLGEAGSVNMSQLKMGAALAWWRPGLAQSTSAASVRSIDSIECATARDLYQSALKNPDIPPAYYDIFRIASYYCGEAGWDDSINLPVEPDGSNSLSIFSSVIPNIKTAGPLDNVVEESLILAGEDVLIARFELSLYYLTKNGEVDLCAAFASSRDWYGEGVFTDPDKENVKFLLRKTCN